MVEAIQMKPPIHELELLQILLPAVTAIDNGCSTCIRGFIDYANWQLRKLQSDYYYFRESNGFIAICDGNDQRVIDYFFDLDKREANMQFNELTLFRDYCKEHSS